MMYRIIFYPLFFVKSFSLQVVVFDVYVECNIHMVVGFCISRSIENGVDVLTTYCTMTRVRDYV